jgi:1-acyl-sn-glycerol-3-phosphate acyltransferase
MSQNPRPSLLYLLIGGLSYPILRLVFRLRSAGKEHLPLQGGYVLASSHQSNFDPWPLGISLFPQRYLRFMAKSELFWFPLGLLVSAVGGFPIKRLEHDARALVTAARLAKGGHVVVMFPEGTRRSKGLRKKHRPAWHAGAAWIALRAGVPLVPVVVGGTDRLTRLARLRVAFGPPIDLGDLGELQTAEAARIATERLRTAIGRLEASLA